MSGPLDRTEAPAYLARYQARRAAQGEGAAGEGAAGEAAQGRRDDDGDAPLYLRRFRQRGADRTLTTKVQWQGETLPATRGWAQITRTKELPDSGHALAPRVEATVHLVRHGETQGYSTESGLTPLGAWQAHRRGFDLSKATKDGETVRIVCADTNRARQTAEHLRRGLLDGLVQWQREAEVSPVTPMPEFLNFQVATPSGLKDVTAAFQEYLEVMERHERVATGERPGWMVEVDRFWRTQQGGGDPIHAWMTIPMVHFEPPSSTVRRFWAGVLRAVALARAALEPGQGHARVVVATHSGPVRAFATSAVGYDPGEPYNTEEVLVRLHAQLSQATVAYRNRVQEVLVPDVAALPDWFATPAHTDAARPPAATTPSPEALNGHHSPDDAPSGAPLEVLS